MPPPRCFASRAPARSFARLTVARAARRRFGDLNYRINIEFAETIELCGGASHTANHVVPAENVAKLMSADQLKLEMAKGKVASRSDAVPRESRPPPPCAATAAAWRAPQSLGMQVFPHFKEGKIDWLPTYRYERDKLQVRIGARCGCGTMQPDPALRARWLKARASRVGRSALGRRVVHCD